MGDYPTWREFLGLSPRVAGPTAAGVSPTPAPVMVAAPPPVQARALERVIDAVIADQAGAVSPADIRALPAVAGAGRLIASTIDQLPLRVGGGPPPDWLADPRKFGATLDAGDLVQHTVDSMLHHGAGYLWVTRLNDGDPPLWLVEPVDPNFVQVQRVDQPTGRVGLSFRVAGEPVAPVPWTASAVPAGQARLLHVPYVVTVDHPQGTTPLTQAARVLRGTVDTEAHTSEVFASGTHVGGILTTEQDITPAQARDYQALFMEGRRAHRIPVLGNGLTYRNDVPSGRDLQLVEARSFNQSVVWALLGIPMAYMGSSLMGGQSSLSYANAQDNRRQFADNCLRAFTTQVEDALSRLLPRGQSAAFDYTEWEGRADDGTADDAGGGVPPA